MKLVKIITATYLKGHSYNVEDTARYPAHYFRKPKNRKEDPSREYTKIKDGVIDDMADIDVCVKSFKVVTNWYEDRG